MDRERVQNTLDDGHLCPPQQKPSTLLRVEDLRSRPYPRYESAGARSTRMIINSASYETTPTDSPPNELRHVFSAQDTHHKVPDIGALVEAERALLENSNGQEKSNPVLDHHTVASGRQERPLAVAKSINVITEDDRGTPTHDISEEEEVITPKGDVVSELHMRLQTIGWNRQGGRQSPIRANNDSKQPQDTQASVDGEKTLVNKKL